MFIFDFRKTFNKNQPIDIYQDKKLIVSTTIELIPTEYRCMKIRSCEIVDNKIIIDAFWM